VLEEIRTRDADGKKENHLLQHEEPAVIDSEEYREGKERNWTIDIH